MRTQTVASAFLAFAVTASCSVGAEEKPGDQRLLQGEWECVASFKEGKQTQSYLGVRATIQDNRLTWSFPKPDGTKRVQRTVFKLDPSKTPKHFDWNPEDKPTEVHRRLYVLEGNTLTWVTNLGMPGHEHEDVRPESLATGKWRFVMKRIQPKK